LFVKIEIIINKLRKKYNLLKHVANFVQHEIKRLPPEQHVKIKVRHELITIKLLIFVVS